jgi:hypothetical protein
MPASPNIRSSSRLVLYTLPKGVLGPPKRIRWRLGDLPQTVSRPETHKQTKPGDEHPDEQRK